MNIKAHLTGYGQHIFHIHITAALFRSVLYRKQRYLSGTASMSTTLTRWPGAKNPSSLRWLHPNLKADGDQALHNNDDSGSEGHDGDDDKNGYIDDDMTIWWGGQHWDRCCWHWPRHPQVGPFVYQALTIKDTVEEDGKSNLHYNEDGSTLTYRPRSPSCQWKWFFWWVICCCFNTDCLINQPAWWWWWWCHYFLMVLLQEILFLGSRTEHWQPGHDLPHGIKPAVSCWYQTVKSTSW